MRRGNKCRRSRGDAAIIGPGAPVSGDSEHRGLRSVNRAVARSPDARHSVLIFLFFAAVFAPPL